MTQRMILIQSPYFFSEERVKTVTDWAAVFGNDQPLSLEIGCGTGHFIVERARNHPGRNYLAIDIFNRGCYKTCRKLEEEGIVNVRVARAEARHFLSHYLAPASLGEIFINCPDPWPKKRHRRRRLVNAEFLRLASDILRPDGAFYFSSDVADYAEEVARLLEGSPDYLRAAAAPVMADLPDYPRSKYMLRALEQGEPMHFIHYRREARPPALSVPPLQAGFRMNWAAASP